MALRLVADTHAYMRGNQLGVDASRTPDLSCEAIAARATTAVELVDGLDALDADALPSQLRLTVETALYRARTWARQGDWYWTAFDPTGNELFGMFAPTAYCGGHALNSVIGGLRSAALGTEGDRYRYLARVADLAAMVDQMAARTAGQHRRGIVMPYAQAVEAPGLLNGLKKQALAVVAVEEDRLSGNGGFRAETARLAGDRVASAFDAFIATVGDAYIAAAGDIVGIAQYPDGRDIYRALVRHHSSTDLTPEEVHEVGLERVAGIRANMAQVRSEAEFDGDDLAYRAHLDADETWRARTPEAITAVFQRYIDRFAPHYDTCFSRPLSDSYDVGPLPEALSESMTFGYFQGPTAERRHGRYLFNARNLAQTGLINIAPLTYHELVPGHHLQGSWQKNNPALHPVRRFSGFSAFAEGWAEYSVALAGELGLYRDPPERFGRLVAEAFLACRLVVDTGMNAMGWSLERARSYMRENSFMPEREIASETLRYGCDIPGQALAYKLGDRELLRQRERMATALGDRFDLRDFHDLLLDAGSLPLQSLDRHIGDLIAAHG